MKAPRNVREIKTGTYWRFINDPYRVWKALPLEPNVEGRSFEITSLVTGKKDETYITGMTGLVRCRKDGQYYQSSKGQIINRKYQSYRWVVQGAVSNLRRISHLIGVPGTDWMLGQLEKQYLLVIDRRRMRAIFVHQMSQLDINKEND